ncbi:glycosyltransferase family 2 protein [Flavobacterium sp. CHNK8]|uniref:glycosyltransferase family 2 protein n=1 Tax=Flavobacterium sp. CHNK8 TaxID=2871165 RepID=UPI001C8D69BF|nr:glycosyltransferase family 2 protein [Flavobacterium sp. CHNK8]QZK90117.1 glycosyltransferase family 2 protein [Flavobacterium sp. CHNK8]
MKIIKVIIPAYNEEHAIEHVINEIPSYVSEIIVVNNNSTDQTVAVAQKAGATVLSENRKGYGHACLKGLDYINTTPNTPDIVVFLDGDYSDYPEDLSKLIAPILNNTADFVIGARVPELRESGSMTPQQIFGNRLATVLMRLFFRSKFTDLGPFRAIRYDTLQSLNMVDKTYGWTVEMQLKVLKKNIRYTEIPVRYKNRIGVSKVSGTVKGTIMAGVKIISWIIKYAFK